jgi:hypothetical protein
MDTAVDLDVVTVPELSQIYDLLFLFQVFQVIPDTEKSATVRRNLLWQVQRRRAPWLIRPDREVGVEQREDMTAHRVVGVPMRVKAGRDLRHG